MTSIDFSPSGLPEIGVDKLTVLSGDVISENLAISRGRGCGSEPMNDKGVANCPSLLLIARGHVILTAERNGNDYVSQTPRRSNYVCILYDVFADGFCNLSQTPSRLHSSYRTSKFHRDNFVFLMENFQPCLLVVTHVAVKMQ